MGDCRPDSARLKWSLRSDRLRDRRYRPGHGNRKVGNSTVWCCENLVRGELSPKGKLFLLVVTATGHQVQVDPLLMGEKAGGQGGAIPLGSSRF